MTQEVLNLLHVSPRGEQQAGALVAELVNCQPRYVGLETEPFKRLLQSVELGSRARPGGHDPTISTLPASPYSGSVLILLLAKSEHDLSRRLGKWEHSPS